MTSSTIAMYLCLAYFPGFFIYSAIMSEKEMQNRWSMFFGYVGLFGVIVGLSDPKFPESNLWALVVGMLAFVVSSKLYRKT